MRVLTDWEKKSTVPMTNASRGGGGGGEGGGAGVAGRVGGGEVIEERRNNGPESIVQYASPNKKKQGSHTGPCGLKRCQTESGTPSAFTFQRGRKNKGGGGYYQSEEVN